MKIDRNSPEYLAGRADMANELAAQVRPADDAEAERLRTGAPVTIADVKAMPVQMQIKYKDDVDRILAQQGGRS